MKRRTRDPGKVTRLDRAAVLVTMLGSPVTLPPGAAGRGLACLVCDKVIGRELADAVMFLPVESAGCECGSISSCAFWTHARCGTPSPDRLMDLARLRLAAHFDHAGAGP